MPTDYQSDGAFVVTLKEVLDGDLNALVKARKNYGESWCKRGGVGAFMMLARKWDRLTQFLENPPTVSYGHPQIDGSGPAFSKYDILGAIAFDQRPEGIIDDIRDLRRYLMLVEAKAMEQGFNPAEVAKDAPAQPRRVSKSPILGAPYGSDSEDDTPPTDKD